MSRAIEAASAPAPTVFVVDDDSALRASLRWLLQAEGLAVATFESAEAFLAGYDPGRPGCLVLDVRLGGMSGLDLQAHLVARRITLPTILMSGYAERAASQRALRGGAISFLEKPFNDDLLLDQVKLAIETDRRARTPT
jgi:two-component system, LuxR family, response regulator FixJ